MHRRNSRRRSDRPAAAASSEKPEDRGGCGTGSGGFCASGSDRDSKVRVLLAACATSNQEACGRKLLPRDSIPNRSLLEKVAASNTLRGSVPQFCDRSYTKGAIVSHGRRYSAAIVSHGRRYLRYIGCGCNACWGRARSRYISNGSGKLNLQPARTVKMGLLNREHNLPISACGLEKRAHQPTIKCET